MMPGLSGIDVLREIRNRAGGEEVPVIMLTAFGHEVRALATAAGALAVFDKPFDLDELSDSVFWAVDWHRHLVWRDLRGLEREPAPGSSSQRRIKAAT